MKCACSCKDSSTSTRVLAGFIMILVEEAGVPVPVPGDFLMLALGCMPRGTGASGTPRHGSGCLIGCLLIGCLLPVPARCSSGPRSGVSPRTLHALDARAPRPSRAVAVPGRGLSPSSWGSGLRIATVIACRGFQGALWRFLPSPGPGRAPVHLDVHLAGPLPRPHCAGRRRRCQPTAGCARLAGAAFLLLVWIARARAIHLGATTEAGAADRRIAGETARLPAAWPH